MWLSAKGDGRSGAKGESGFHPEAGYLATVRRVAINVLLANF